LFLHINTLISNTEIFLLSFTASIYDALGWPGVTILMALESTIIPLPSEIIMPLAGWKLVLDKGLGHTHIVLAGVYGAVGCLIGSIIEYYIARAGGRHLIKKYGKYILITEKDLTWAERWFDKRGDITVLIGRMIPGIRGFISIPAGVAKMNVTKFMTFTFIGSFPWTLGLAWGGYALGDNYEAIREISRPFDLPILLVVLILIAIFLWYRLKEIKNQSN
jgi:membrane protein DedA with SNARE-associated domain